MGVAHRVAHRVAHGLAHGLAHGPRPRFCPHPTQTMQNALRWPAASNSTNKAPIPTQLKNLVRKCPQWEEELPPLFKATEIILNISRCDLCTSSCTKSKPPKPRRAKPETQIVPRVLRSRS